MQILKTMNNTDSAFFPLNNLDMAVLQDLRKKLIRFDYDEETIKNLLKIHDPYISLLSTLQPIYRHLVNRKTHLNMLVSLFLLRMPLKIRDAHRLFTKSQIRKLSEMKIFAVDFKNQSVISNVAIYPLRNFFFFVDCRGIKEDVVYLIGLDSFYLAEAISQLNGDSFLDLCCGSGVQAIVASRNFKEVVGVDINPRAVNFSRFNAIFNAAHNVHFELGDMYVPVLNKKFDVIAANPPFVAAPKGAKEILYRSSGQLGNNHVRLITAGLPKHLKDSGICIIITEIKKRAGISNKEEIKILTGSLRLKVFQMPIFERCICASCYSVGHCNHFLAISDFKSYEKELMRWYANLEHNRITHIALTLLCIKKSESFKVVELKTDEKNFALNETVRNLFKI